MRKRIVALLAAAALLASLAMGCSNKGTVEEPAGEKGNQAQLVVAMNPVFLYDDNATVIAYNDIKNAVRTDREASNLTALYQTTAWKWAYQEDTYWQQRGIYELRKWRNGAGKSAKKTYAYALNADGSVSLGSYAAGTTALTTYQGETVPDCGLLLSVTGQKEEALCYTVAQDGVLFITAGTITAIEAVDGVKTGFLAEDGTPRKASVRILRNGVQLWSGTLQNTTAATDGVAVTALEYPQINDIAVSAGDQVMIAVQLEAQANRDEDVSAPEMNEEDNWTIVRTASQVEVSHTIDATRSDNSLAFVVDYQSAFTWLRYSKASEEETALANEYYERFANRLNADVPYHNETHDEEKYEIVIGRNPARPQSEAIYNELISARVNHANDYTIRLVDNKLYIVGTNVYSLRAALEYFMEKLCVDDDSSVPAGYTYSHAEKTETVTVCGANISTYVIRTEKYPSYLVWMAAENLQEYIRTHCGYCIDILPMTDDGKTYANEIRVGPIQGTVKANRVYDTRFTSADTDAYLSVDADGLLEVPQTDYQIAIQGNALVLNGGSTYAINAGMQRLLQNLDTQKAIDSRYAVTGSYDQKYSLSGGYALTLADEFNYTGTDEEVETAVRRLWGMSNDTTPGPTPLAKDSNGNVTIWDQQRRPDQYGQNWWIWHSDNNGYLMEVTKKESYGYDAIRLVSENRMSFRFGIWETRLVMATRNGACSCLWTENQKPLKTALRPEIDVYENYGADGFHANLHTWDDYTLDPTDGHVDHNVEDYSFHWVTPAAGEHFYDTFHHMGFVWTADGIDLFMDNVVYDSISFNSSRWNAFRTTSGIIRLTNGVGAEKYARVNPQDVMSDVSRFFEVSIIDYTRIYQPDYRSMAQEEQPQLVFGRGSGWMDTPFVQFTNK